MTMKEMLLYHAAKSILLKECPNNNKYYLCRTHPDETEEIKCQECWNRYLLDILNGGIQNEL